MAIESIDSVDLKNRYEILVSKYIDMLPLLTKQLEEFGRVRNELQIIVVELQKRDLSTEDIDKKYESKTT